MNVCDFKCVDCRFAVGYDCRRHAPIIRIHKDGTKEAEWPPLHDLSTGCGDFEMRL